MTNQALLALLERLERKDIHFVGSGHTRARVERLVNLDGPEAAQAIRGLMEENERLRQALERQTDNVSFLLNRVDAMAWHDKFESELAEDRLALSVSRLGQAQK